MTYLYTYDMNITMFEISEKGEYDDERYADHAGG